MTAAKIPAETKHAKVEIAMHLRQTHGVDGVGRLAGERAEAAFEPEAGAALDHKVDARAQLIEDLDQRQAEVEDAARMDRRSQAVADVEHFRFAGGRARPHQSVP